MDLNFEQMDGSADSRMLTQLADRLGINLGDYSRLMQAITHKSFRYEASGFAAELVPTGVEVVPSSLGMGAGDNERLEFLGDAVLDLALSQILMVRFPMDTEGGLSKKRASLVNEEQLADLARGLGVDQVLRLGKGERQTGGVGKPRLLASALEAIFGAVFLDLGFEACSNLIETIYAEKLTKLEFEPDFAMDFKTRLQEKMQERFRTTPTYAVESESGPDHDKKFNVSVKIEEQILGHGIGRNKKAAEQDAARDALVGLAEKLSVNLDATTRSLGAETSSEEVING